MSSQDPALQEYESDDDTTTNNTISTSTTATLHEEEIDFSKADALLLQNLSKDNDEEDEKDNENLKDKKSKKKKDKKSSAESHTIPMSQMFRFATPLDKLYILIGTMAAFAHGIALPLMPIIFFGFIDAFGRFSLALSKYNDTRNEGLYEEAKSALDADIRKFVYYFLILGVSIFLASYLQMTFWTIAGENQANVIIK
jgi:hypothetical protein